MSLDNASFVNAQEVVGARKRHKLDRPRPSVFTRLLTHACGTIDFAYRAARARKRVSGKGALIGADDNAIRRTQLQVQGRFALQAL